MERTVFPERTLFCTIKIGDQTVKVLNFHSLTGVDCKKAKSSNFASIAEFLEEHNEIDFMCFDANEPNIDSMQDSEIVCYDNRDKGTCASLILGNNKVHNLKDSYISYLRNTNQHITENPLTVSYIKKYKKKI